MISDGEEFSTFLGFKRFWVEIVDENTEILRL